MSTWQPSATIEALTARAAILRTIRNFFLTRKVIEVETPTLADFGVTDLYIDNVRAKAPEAGFPQLFLQTSPEYFMKRLLAFGSGSIYQIGKAYRDEQTGPLHQIEFSMLEWYRLNFDHHQLMQEVDELVQGILNTPPAEKITYQALFQTHLQLCPFRAGIKELAKVAKAHKIELASELSSKDEWLFLLLSHLIEPHLAKERPLFVYDYPVSQGSLARLNQQGDRAHRFELYYQGVELANGFWELCDRDEQQARFRQDLTLREAENRPSIALDPFFLEALEAGLPECSGVALGLDRLIMLALNAKSLNEVISFAR
jgi:lysyl-tRNA synthetase class 2